MLIKIRLYRFIENVVAIFQIDPEVLVALCCRWLVTPESNLLEWCWGKRCRSWVTMAQFKFGMFYFRDNTIHIESTDIVTPQNRQQLIQVLKRPDLSSEDGWIQVCWGTRKEPKNKVAAKLLLLGGLYCSCMVWSIFWINILSTND